MERGVRVDPEIAIEQSALSVVDQAVHVTSRLVGRTGCRRSSGFGGRAGRRIGKLLAVRCSSAPVWVQCSNYCSDSCFGGAGDREAVEVCGWYTACDLMLFGVVKIFRRDSL